MSNVVEVDAEGKPAIGWCFVPKRDLAAGDAEAVCQEDRARNRGSRSARARPPLFAQKHPLCPGAPTHAPHRWLSDIPTKWRAEDGAIWVYGVGEDGVQAFADLIENLIELIRFYKKKLGLLRRYLAANAEWIGEGLSERGTACCRPDTMGRGPARQGKALSLEFPLLSREPGSQSIPAAQNNAAPFWSGREQTGSPNDVFENVSAW